MNYYQLNVSLSHFDVVNCSYYNIFNHVIKHFLLDHLSFDILITSNLLESGVVDLSTSEMHYLTQWTNLLYDQYTSLELQQDINCTGKLHWILFKVIFCFFSIFICLFI